MLEDPVAALARAEEAGVARVVTIGTDGPTSQGAVDWARRDPRVYATVGLHPHDAKTADDALWGRFEALAAEPRCVGIGEAGLDYHYGHSPREDQLRVFERHVALADATDRALVIHTREAWDDTWRVLEPARHLRIVFHCFTGGPDEAERALELGASLSFSGIVTFRNAGEIRAAARLTPLDRLLVETDSPYLAPIPHRGRPNEPAFVAQTAAFLAELKGVDLSTLAQAATDATRRVFRLAPDQGGFASVP